MASPGVTVYAATAPVMPAIIASVQARTSWQPIKPQRRRDVGAALALEDGDLTDERASELRLGGDFLGANSGVAREIDG